MKEIVEGIKEAKINLEVAENRFNNAINYDDIDIAIFELNAAEIRMNSIIKSAKPENK